MHVQKSFSATGAGIARESSGVLYIVATPIGNLEDITVRALKTLREADWIAAEDTRHTRKLLSYFEIHSKLKSYHEHNKQESGAQILQLLLAGDSVALVSDAGMPAISDPGFELVQSALEHSVRVVPIPGANAALSALVASGLETAAFTFCGFLPRDKKGLRQALERWRTHRQTLIFYEAPHRIKQTLTAMLGIWGDRRIAIARELTKKYEEFLRGCLSECLAYVAEHGAQGEYCLVVEGAPDAADEPLQVAPAKTSVVEAVDHLVAMGVELKEAMRQVARERGVSKRVVYQEYLQNH